MSQAIDTQNDRRDPVLPGAAEADGLDGALASKTFLRIKDLGRKSRAIGLRLRVGDIVVALDGKPFHGTLAELTDHMSPPEEDELATEDSEDLFLEEAPQKVEKPKFLMTVARGGIFFEVFAEGPLGCELDYVLPEEALGIKKAFGQRKIYPLEDYIGYEVYRDITRKCCLVDQTPSLLAAVAPPLWLLENRMLEPLLAVISIYGLTFGINIYLFIATYVLTALYFQRGQLVFKRSYQMFEQRHMWIYLVATNPRDAQITCRMLDPKADFEFSLIPPPRPARKPA